MITLTELEEERKADGEHGPWRVGAVTIARGHVGIARSSHWQRSPRYIPRYTVDSPDAAEGCRLAFSVHHASPMVEMSACRARPLRWPCIALITDCFSYLSFSTIFASGPRHEFWRASAPRFGATPSHWQNARYASHREKHAFASWLTRPHVMGRRVRNSPRK
jgi:hypothetical protein